MEVRDLLVLQDTMEINMKDHHNRLLPGNGIEVTETIRTLDFSSMQVEEEITGLLEYMQRELYVKKYIRPEYIKPNEDGTQVRRNCFGAQYAHRQEFCRSFSAGTYDGKQMRQSFAYLQTIANVYTAENSDPR